MARSGPIQVEGTRFAKRDGAVSPAPQRRTPTREEDVRYNNRRIAEGLTALASLVLLGCENPVATNHAPAPVALAATAVDRLPHLGKARVSGLSISPTSDGRRLLRFSTTIVNSR